jgi:ABC-type protease/lipase transport system fused ATPase/permease subunit
MGLKLIQPLLGPLRAVLGYSLLINLTLLAPSIFMLQVFNRVLSTRRVETMLVMAVVAVATLAYTLMINLRRLGLQGTELAQACTATIRTKLLKIGAAVLHNTRRVRVLLASAHPMKHVFLAAAGALSP